MPGRQGDIALCFISLRLSVPHGQPLANIPVAPSPGPWHHVRFYWLGKFNIDLGRYWYGIGTLCSYFPLATAPSEPRHSCVLPCGCPMMWGRALSVHQIAVRPLRLQEAKTILQHGLLYFTVVKNQEGQPSLMEKLFCTQEVGRSRGAFITVAVAAVALVLFWKGNRC